MPTLRRGSAASPHHSFSSPSAPRFRQPDISYHSNDGASIMSMGRPENSTGEQKAVNALVNKLVNKLPCNSGTPLTILEQDAGVKATVQSILQLSRLRLPLVAHALVSALETLSKYTNPYHFLADISLDVLHSQLYLLHVLNFCFSTSWRLHAQSSPSQSPSFDVPRPWSDPPPFEESLAKYVLSVLLVYTRLVSLESDFVDIGTQPVKEPKGLGSGSSSSWGKGATTSSGYSLGTKFLLQHSYPLVSQPPSAERHISPNCTTTTGTVAQMTKYVARAVFYLSSANWPLVFSLIKKRIQYLTTTIEDAPDLNELRLVEWVNVDQSRLSQLLAEVTNAFLHTKRPAQSTVAMMLRKAIRNWININPKEYELFIEAGRKMEGGPDALFDVLYSMSDLGSFSNSKRTRTFYPLMAMLLVLCPDTFKRLAMGESARGSSSFSKKMSFLDSFKKGLNSTKGFEACAICYVEWMSAGMALTPRLDGSGIRSFIPDIQNDLKNALFYSPMSNELSDMNILVEGLVALYRANPTTTGGLLFPKLWNDSELSKVVAVKACILMAVEGGRLPWHPPLIDIMREVGPSIRGLIKAHAMTVTADRLGPRRPRGSIELPGAQTDLAYEILKLYALEPSFSVINVRIDNSSDSVSSLFLTLASLLVIPSPEIIRTATAKACISLINYVREGCGQGESMKNLGHNAAGGIWQMLLDVGRQMLFAFHDGDYDEITISATSMRDMLYAVIQLAEAHPEILFPSSKAQPAAMVVSAAGYVCIVSPDVEQTALTLPSFMALGKLTMLAHRSASGEVITNAYSQYPQSRAVVFERLAVLPTAVGRQQQQRMIRRTLRPMARGSTLTTSVWVGLLSIWKSLTTKIIAFDAGNSITSRDRRRVMTADIDGLDEQESKEWQNLTYFLCSLTSVGICTSPPSSLTVAIGKEGLLPAAYDQDISEPFGIVEGFIKQCVELLVTNSVAIRESVKTALGSEYPTSMCGLLVAQISRLLSRAFGPTGVNVSDAFNTLVEQSVNILRLQIDRMGPDDDMPTVQVEMGELLHKLGQYIQRLGRSDLAVRLKTRYCQLVEVALSKKDHVVAENGPGLKNSVMEWLCEWSIDTSRDEFYSAGIGSYDRSQKELDHACLKAMVPVTEGLVLRLGGEEAEDPQGVLKSRLFYRHYHHLVKVIEKTNIEETQSMSHPPSIQGQTSARSGTPEDPPTLAILALSNLLSSNIDVGLKHCLALGYHDDPALRTVFMQLLTNILQQGTRFGGLAAKRASLAPKLFLENLTSTNMALALAMVDVCPQSGPDMDELSTLLFRVFEGNGTLLGFMRLLIEREVTVTNHESELFRANSLTMRMITMFAKTYGYNYVRATLQPLVLSLAEKPAECSFELDPRKASATDDIDRNADHLKLMCQALLDLICASTPKVPLMFRALCHHIWEVVDDRFPDSRHSAVGSFIFLRFFCPAIVSPDTIDLDTAPDNAQTRRALLLITKVIQNLANNVVFKEPHMKMLNPFLSDNIKQVTKFLSDVAIRPKTVDVQTAAKAFQEDAEKSQDLDADDAIIHRFVFKNQAKLEGSLTGMPKSYYHSASASKVKRTDIDGKDALEKLRTVMKATGPPADTNLLSASARAQAYDEFMRQNQGRNIDSVKDVFYEGPASQNGRRIFYFVVAKVALIDYDLLAYHVFKSLDNVTEYFDVVIDLTDFSSSTELPMPWLKKSLQICPSAILSSIFTLVLYNPNTYSRKRLKRIISELLTVSPPVGKNVAAASSPGELVDHIQFTSLALPEHTMVLAYEADHVFTNLVCLSDHGMQVPVVVKLGHDCLQVASWRKQDLTSNIRSYIIDVVKLADIDDIVTSGGIPADQLVIKHSQNETLIFVSRKRNEMAHIIKSARARLRDAPINSRALRPSDVPATLLNVALLNLSSDNETLRMGAYILVQELSQFFKYDLAARVLKVSAGLTIPNNSLFWVRDLSSALSNSAPHLTLEFLKEWTIGFSKADIPYKTASLHYIGPWLQNLDQFSRPTRDDAEESVKQVREVIRSFISITVAERRRLHLTIQEHLWGPLAKSHGSLLDIMIFELIYGAIDAGLGSDKTECISDILVSISSTNVRGKVIARLRKSLAQTYLRPSNHLTENATWNEVCALARITLALSFNPTTALDTQLFLPEIFHVITLLLGAGPLVMRQTVYGLLVSILHSLASNATSGEMDGPTLVKLSNRLSRPEMMAAFGVSQSHGHIELSGLPNKNETDVHLLDRVEEVSKFLGDVLAAGATSVDCANAWRARWMGLVAATCFQHNPATQPQAFTVLGFLVSDEVDDDLIYQILVAMSTALSHFAESHSILIISMLRCLSRIIPGLLPDSRYATSLFWLAVGVLQLGYIPLFAPALELLVTALRSIHNASPDVPCAELMEYVLDSRSVVADETQKLDHVCGVSFDVDISFALVAIIYKGVRHPSTRKLTIEVLLDLLRMSASPAQRSGEDEPSVAEEGIAYFVALLSIVANSPEEVKSVFLAAGLPVDEDTVDLGPIPIFSLLSVPDNRRAVLLISLVVALLSGSGGSDAEKVVLYRLLADASAELPEVVRMVYSSLIPRIMSTLGATSNISIIQSSTVILERALMDDTYAFPNLSAIPSTDSSTSLPHGHSRPYASSISSTPSVVAGTKEQLLEDIGMKGLGELAFPQVKADRLSMMARWVASLIENFTI